MSQTRLRVVKINSSSCRICCKALRNSLTIPCGHKFCLQCIEDHWDRDERKNRKRSCPQCGCQFPSKPLAQKRPWSSTETGSGRTETGSGGTETGSGGTVCRRHSSPLNIYCCTDEQIICAVCASAEHKGHTTGSVREERRRKQEELKNMQMKSMQILQEQEKKWKETLEQIEEEAGETQDYCEGVLVGVIDSLQRHYMSLRKLIRGHKKEAAAQVQTSLQTLQDKMEDIKKGDSELAQTDSDVHFLQKCPSLRRLCDKDHLHEVSGDPLLPFEWTRRAVEQLGKQLEEFCDKEFASICQTADDEEQQESGEETEDDDMQQRCEASTSQSYAGDEEQQESGEESEDDNMQQRCEASTSQSYGLSGVNNTLTEQNEEPKTRAEFLQYACALSLDPTTAHEDLVISAGDLEVRRSPLEYKLSSAVRYPQRFVHRRQVLCREGLQAEHCYYEIEVEGGKAEIALAYEGINRKSSTRLSAFGAKANSWSLDRSTYYSVSHRADSIQLKAQPSHRRLGVYLKFKEGTLSFYEVSGDSMMFLYKVTAEFTEPLYPGFWLDEKCCIRICDLRQDSL